METFSFSITGNRAVARTTIAASAAMGCLLLALTACGQKETANPAAESSPRPGMSDAKVDAAVVDALTPPRPIEPTGAYRDPVLERADAILDEFPNKTAVELLNLPEVNQALRGALEKLSKDKALQERINNSVALAAKMKGLSAAPGTLGLDLDTSGYDASRKRRMLDAVLTGDPKQIVGFLTQEIGEASVELSYGGVNRAANGIAIKETLPPAPAAQ